MDSKGYQPRLVGNRGGTVCYMPDKNQIAIGSFDNVIKIWDLDTGAILKTLAGHTGSVITMCYIQEKNQIVSGSTDKTIKIWDLDSGKESEEFQPRSGFCPTGAEIKTLIGHQDWVWEVCQIQEKNQIASCSSDGTIKIWDLSIGASIKSIIGDNNGSVFSMCYISEKNQIAFTSDKTIKIWDLNTGAVVKSLCGKNGTIWTICYISGKNQIVSAGFYGIIKVWDLDSGKESKEFQHHPGVNTVCHLKIDSAVAKRLKN